MKAHKNYIFGIKSGKNVQYSDNQIVDVVVVCYTRYATTNAVREIGKNAFHVSDISWS